MFLILHFPVHCYFFIILTLYNRLLIYLLSSFLFSFYVFSPPALFLSSPLHSVTYHYSGLKVRGVSWTGRTDTNKRVVFPSSLSTSPVLYGLSKEEAMLFASLPVAWTEQGKEVVKEAEKEEKVVMKEDIVGDKIQQHMGSTLPMQGSGRGSARGSVAVDVTEGIEAVATLVRTIEEQRGRERERRRGSIGGEEDRGGEGGVKEVEKGTYVVVKILSARGHTLR